MQILPPFDKIGVTPVPPFVNAAPNGGAPGSIVNAQVFNALQDEMANAIAAQGLTPTDADYTQLFQSIAYGGIYVGTFGYSAAVAAGNGSTGSPETYTAALPPGASISALHVGMRLIGQIANANATTSPVLQFTGATGGAVSAPLHRRDSAAPAVGDIAARFTAFRWDGAAFQLDGISLSELIALIASNLPPLNSGLSTSFRGLAGAAAGGTKTANYTVELITAAASLTAAGNQRGSNLSLSLNCAAVGAGGLDTGALVANAGYAVYAIYSPTANNGAGAWSVLATAQAGNGVQASVYPGTAMPSGYGPSCLIGGFTTDATGNIVRFQQIDRQVWTTPVQINASLSSGAWALVGSFASATPSFAKSWLPDGLCTTSGAATNLYLSPIAAEGPGRSEMWSGTNNNALTIPSVPFIAPLTAYHRITQGQTWQLNCVGWTF